LNGEGGGGSDDVGFAALLSSSPVTMVGPVIDGAGR
jgi:hypothetical protein